MLLSTAIPIVIAAIVIVIITKGMLSEPIIPKIKKAAKKFGTIPIKESCIFLNKIKNIKNIPSNTIPKVRIWDLNKLCSKLLNSKIGEVFLSRLSIIIHPNKISDKKLSRKAIRSAIILSSYNNNQKISLLDFFKEYPNKNVALDLNALSKALKKVESIKELIDFYSDSPFKKLKDGRSNT